MTTPRYLPVQALKDYVRSELQVDDQFYEEAINAAESTLDNACGRRFEVAPASATARSFAPQGRSRTLVIDDFTSVTSVVDNGTTLVSGTDYQAEPLNGLSSTGEAWPYYRLVRPYANWYWPTNLATITVTAKWGWAAIPPQIVEACKIIAKDIFQQRDIRFGLVAVSEAGGVGTRQNQIVRDAIRDYGAADAVWVF